MKILPNKLRKKVLEMVYKKKSGHIGPCFSIAEVISVLYSDYSINERDKLILSKGHAVPILYAVMHELFKISDADLDLFREIDSPLQGHPHKGALSHIDATTGSLGQGLSIAIGHALGKSLRKEEGSVFCILGDGEIQEGQIWESLMYFPKLKLNNLVCLIDYNKYQSDGSSDDTINVYKNLQEMISLLGWNTVKIDGHNVKKIREALTIESDKPLCVILDTVKGKGVSFMETQNYHSCIPSEEEYEKALKELEVNDEID